MVETTTISDNHVGADGGGLYNTAGDVTATASAITRNRAAAGGGIYDGSGPDNVTLTATPVLNNRPDNCDASATMRTVPPESPSGTSWSANLRGHRSQADPVASYRNVCEMLATDDVETLTR